MRIIQILISHVILNNDERIISSHVFDQFWYGIVIQCANVSFLFNLNLKSIGKFMNKNKKLNIEYI